MELDFEEIERILQVFAASAATELEVESEGVQLRFKKAEHVRRQVEEPEAGEAEEAGGEDEAVYDYVRADRVGFFYLGAKPEGEPLVSAGDLIEKGQQVGCIVAIGVENPLTAQVGGKVVEVLIGEGQAVEYGEPVLKVEVEPAGETTE